MTNSPNPEEKAPETPRSEGREWTEEFKIAGNQLVASVKALLAEGNVRRVIIRAPDDRVLLEIPLTATVAVGGVVTIFAPVLAVLGALAALVAQVKVQVVRDNS
ncbi:MAG: DUF4342 domain-containing protein [Chloroflexi bacterium]|nr:DUF4342 domain-containing protein [Chloroflexota bacterium]